MTGSVFNEMVIFQDFNQEQRDILRPLFLLTFAPAGIVIFEQDQPADFLYLVAQGEVHIRFKPEDGPALTVARVRPEGVAGWSAAIGSPRYTSSAVCATDSQMLRVRSQDLRRLCERDPQTGDMLLEKLAAIVAERLRNTHPHILALLQQGLSLPVERFVAAG
jgi:CRP/FNR family transcriptional regulator, cyclic AMP receptor protein